MLSGRTWWGRCRYAHYGFGAVREDQGDLNRGDAIPFYGLLIPAAGIYISEEGGIVKTLSDVLRLCSSGLSHGDINNHKVTITQEESKDEARRQKKSVSICIGNDIVTLFGRGRPVSMGKVGEGAAGRVRIQESPQYHSGVRRL